MREPLLIIDAIHDIPSNTTITTPSGTTGDVLDSTKYNMTIPTIGSQYDGQTVDFQTGIKILINLLSPFNVLTWARQYTEGLTSVNPTNYSGKIEAMVGLIRSTLARFPSDVSDIRAVLEVAQRAGLNRWVRGIYFDVTKEMNYQPVFNKLCHDVFTNYLASPNTIYYDNVTLRWKFYSLWNEYLGIPKYDKVNGGSFLSFSTRQFESTVVPSTDTKFLIPKLFDIPAANYNPVDFVNRLGVTATLGYTIYNASALANSPIYARLNSLSFSDFDQRIPYANIASGYQSVPNTGSSLFRLMTNLFGIGNIQVSANDINETLDSDIVSAVDIELDDVSNAMIAFAQAYAPFKVYTPVTERTVGFKETPSAIR
jgi:hypothetical protein